MTITSEPQTRPWRAGTGAGSPVQNAQFLERIAQATEASMAVLIELQADFNALRAAMAESTQAANTAAQSMSQIAGALGTLVRGSLPMPASPPLSAGLELEPSGSTPAPISQSLSHCSIHGVEMRPHTRDGKTWYSHKTPQGWCKGK